MRVVWWMCTAVLEGRVINDILVLEEMGTFETSLLFTDYMASHSIR
jgi:hypothetical protein